MEIVEIVQALLQAGADPNKCSCEWNGIPCDRNPYLRDPRDPCDPCDPCDNTPLRRLPTGHSKTIGQIAALLFKAGARDSWGAFMRRMPPAQIVRNRRVCCAIWCMQRGTRFPAEIIQTIVRLARGV